MKLSPKQEDRLLKALDANNKNKLKRLEAYEKQPNICDNCKNTLTYDKRKNKYCSQSCAAIQNNKGVRRNVSEGAYVKKNCLHCGSQTCNIKFCSQFCNFEFNKQNRLKKIVECGEAPSNQAIAKRYILELQGRQCSICKRIEWDGQDIPLVLDHIDGKPDNWKLDNLRLVCGNCNMLLPTFAGKNIGNGGRPYRNQRYIEGKSY